jgi:hypothetical protein
VIVDRIYIDCFAVLEAEDDPAVGPDRSSPETLQVAFEAVQTKAGPVHCRDHRRRIQGGQNDGDTLCQIGRDLASVVPLVESFQALVPETLDHRRSL